MSAAEADVNFGAVVPSISIENMVQMRAAVIERFNQLVKLYEEMRAIATAANIGSPELRIHSGCDTAPLVHEDAQQWAITDIDRQAWQYLMSESGLRTFMDAETRRKWDDQLEKRGYYQSRKGVEPIPPLTVANVEATFRSLHAERGMMFERGVISCFKRLSWDYKTNNPFRFGKRIIINYLFTVYSPHDPKTRMMHLRHEATDELDDLVRVFSVLDGKPEPDHRQGVYDCIRKYEGPLHSAPQRMEAEHEYFHVRWFYKGSGHVTFKRLDLVDQLNAIIARRFPGALPAPRGE